MQHNRNPAGASPTPPASTAVVGLDVCDVLRVELDPSQMPVLFEEIELQRQVYEEAIGGALDAEDQESLDRFRRERRTLATIVEQLHPFAERPVIWGPAPMISDMVACAARSARSPRRSTAHDTGANSPHHQRRIHTLACMPRSCHHSVARRLSAVLASTWFAAWEISAPPHECPTSAMRQLPRGLRRRQLVSRFLRLASGGGREVDPPRRAQDRLTPRDVAPRHPWVPIPSRASLWGVQPSLVTRQ
jgi:hypothetical protein